ncbi:MBL fold metallo-hydrolase [candidate division KSB1 bacterium]
MKNFAVCLALIILLACQSAISQTSSTGSTNRIQNRQETGFSVVTVGTGNPDYNPERGSACTMIKYNGNYILVDMGNGTQARLREGGVRLPRISTLMFTHHHLDHSEEFIPIFIYSRLRGGSRNVITPKGTRNYVDFALDFYREYIEYRIGWDGLHNKDEYYDYNVREVEHGDKFEVDGLTVTAAEVQHTIYTLAYRFQADEKSIVVSGDLVYSENLVELAKDADVLVMDGYPVRSRRTVRKNVNPDSAAQRSAGNQQQRTQRVRVETQTVDLDTIPIWKRTRAQIRSHGSLEEMARMAGEAGVKKLVFTHLGRNNVDEEGTLEVVRNFFQGEVIFAVDLMEIFPD